MTEHMVKFEWQNPGSGFCFVPARYTGGELYHREGFSFGREEEQRLDRDLVMPYLLPAIALEANQELDYTRAQIHERLRSPIGLHEIPAYNPFQAAPALYREFAELNTSCLVPEILKFANKWGSLGGDASVEVNLVDDEWRPIVGKTYLWAESPFHWCDEILKMRLALETWDMIRLKDDEALHNLISWENGEALWSHKIGDAPSENPDKRDLVWTVDVREGEKFYSASFGHDLGQGPVATEDYHPERLKTLTQESPEPAARFIVGDLVNEGLAGRVSAQLSERAGEGSSVLRLMPDSLIGALWLQFAFAVDGNLDYKRCEECQTWLEIAPGAGRPDRSYCSDACRMRAYRKRAKAKKHNGLANR